MKPGDTVAPITVIIPSYMRRESLQNVIADLAKQTLKPKQIFIVDASPKEQQIVMSPKLNVHVLSFEGIPNVSAQRNVVLPKVVTPWILFLDDDVRFEADLLQKYLNAIRSVECDGVNGLVKLPKHEKYYSVKKTSDRLRNLRAENLQGSEQIVETYVVCTANFLCKTESVQAVGGFDEQLAGTIDDVDLALRLRNKGYKIVHHPLPEVLHLQLKGSGARAFGHEWSLTHLFYFQYRHFENPNRNSLLLNTLWHYCRPSRDWRYPLLVLNRARDIISANRKAIRKYQEGEKLLLQETLNAHRILDQ